MSKLDVAHRIIDQVLDLRHASHESSVAPTPQAETKVR